MKSITEPHFRLKAKPIPPLPGWKTEVPKAVGTYIHGILDNPSVIDWLVAPYAGKKAVSSPDYAAYKEEQYNKLADHVRSHLNMPLIYQILTAHD